MPALKNLKHERFCQEYMIDLNITQAAIRVGYSPRTAAEQGSRLLKNVKVRARVDELMAIQSRRTGISVDRVIRELARVAFANEDDIIDAKTAMLKDGVSRDDTAAVSSVRVKITSTEDGESVEREIKLHDKPRTLELLGRHLGMFTDKVEHSGQIDTGNQALASILRQLQQGDDGETEQEAPAASDSG